MGLFEDFYSDLFDGHQSQESRECQTEFGRGREEGRAGEGQLESLAADAFCVIPQTEQYRSRIAGIREGLKETDSGDADECESYEADSNDGHDADTDEDVEEYYAADDDDTDEDDDAAEDEGAEHGHGAHHPGSGDPGVRTIVRHRLVVYSGGVLLAEKEYDENHPLFYSEQSRLEFVLGALLGDQEMNEEEEYDEEEEDDCEED